MNQKERRKILTQLLLESLAAKKEEAPKAQPNKRLRERMARKAADPLKPGVKINSLLLIGPSNLRKDKQILWECLCDCGKHVFLRSYNLRKGQKSCGCKVGEAVGIANKLRDSHHLARTPEYRTWVGMRARCVNPKITHYHLYGGRGVSVCERWEDFKNFWEDMGPRPDGHSIERIDTNGNYSPENCKWGTHREQYDNKRAAIRVLIDNEWITVREAAIKLNTTDPAIRGRVVMGKIQSKKVYDN